MFGFFVKVKVERSLYDKLRGKAGQRGYATVDEMINHLLESAVADDSDPPENGDQVERRLRGLGYIE